MPMPSQVLEDQKAEESRRGKMMEHLFSSEAEGFWAKQDKTWREEKAARNKLMDDVVSGWKEQVGERLKGELGYHSSLISKIMATLGLYLQSPTPHGICSQNRGTSLRSFRWSDSDWSARWRG